MHRSWDYRPSGTVSGYSWWETDHVFQPSGTVSGYSRLETVDVVIQLPVGIADIDTPHAHDTETRVITSRPPQGNAHA
jgi:hypothetical protein